MSVSAGFMVVTISPLFEVVRENPKRLTLTTAGPKVWEYSEIRTSRRDWSATCLLSKLSGCSTSASSKRSVPLKLPTGSL